MTPMRRGSIRGRVLRSAIVLFLFGLLVGAGACPYSIRDAGFIVRDPEPYRLLAFVKDEGQWGEEVVKPLLERAAERHLDHSNVKAEVVNVDRQPDHKALAHLEALKPEQRKEFPVHALVSPQGKAIALPPRPEGDMQALYEGMARDVVQSPARQDIVAHIIEEWCVVLVVTGEDEAENARVTAVAEEASKAIVGFKPQMGPRIERPPHVMTISRREAQRAERVLVWSLGLDEGDSQEARAAVLFGMGRRLGPALSGDEVSRTRLMDAFRLLGRNCTCTTDPSQILGPALPLVWGRDLQELVRDTLGFDPNSPAVANTLSGVWTTLREPGDRAPGGEFLPDPATGYIEFSVGPEEGQEGQEGEAEMGDRGEAPTIEQRGLKVVIAVAAGLAAIAVGGTAALILRQRRRA